MHTRARVPNGRAAPRQGIRKELDEMRANTMKAAMATNQVRGGRSKIGLWHWHFNGAVAPLSLHECNNMTTLPTCITTHFSKQTTKTQQKQAS